jgi:hypothetical protein
MQAYDGLGPEVTNSRLAMLGFAVAAFWELTQGIDVFQQVDRYPLITIATFVVFTVASWIPFMQGQSYNVKSGPFTPAVSTAAAWAPCLGIATPAFLLQQRVLPCPFARLHLESVYSFIPAGHPVHDVHSCQHCLRSGLNSIVQRVC